MDVSNAILRGNIWSEKPGHLIKYDLVQSLIHFILTDNTHVEPFYLVNSKLNIRSSLLWRLNIYLGCLDGCFECHFTRKQEQKVWTLDYDLVW